MIVWVGRHDPLLAELDALRRAYGDAPVLRVRWVSTAEELHEMALAIGARAVSGTMPLTIYMRLAEMDKPYDVLFPEMEEVVKEAEAPPQVDGYRCTVVERRRGPRVVYDAVCFKRFIRVKRIVIDGEPL